jgi:hypothetical protein
MIVPPLHATSESGKRRIAAPPSIRAFGERKRPLKFRCPFCIIRPSMGRGAMDMPEINQQTWAVGKEFGR